MDQDGDPIPEPSAVPEADPETAVWVRELARKRGLNCSKLLEEAILDTVGIRPTRQTAREDV